ncbi:hypothetical protein CY34DRAFT_25606 [Suillus luteus UH-Slu-Lm8-n1]|uniref:Integrase zinc-binding domain-containing protein n=1 Tax=Suillus luteus UH-Slu-Lm8-n1 TaxID=930992 RepID=A0A0C9ZLX7_9AGAM|nr:hypothetical protein CY34DRAFT_25606 [Suillus luteus UH-Slu-Lm8-n1]
MLKEVHDNLGHKGVYTTHVHLMLCFWWSHIVKDVMRKLYIPPTVPMPGGLFRKAHIDTMKMPKAGGFEYIMQAQCTLTSYPKRCMLCKENTNCDGDDTRWYQVVHCAFWAERITIHHVTGLLPYFMVHGLRRNTTTDLIAWRTHQLQKHKSDLDVIKDKVVAACFKSICNFEQCFRTSIKSYEFVPGILVLVHNSKGGSYMLTELDGMISKLCFAMFHVIPYYPRSKYCISVTQMTGIDDNSIDQPEAGKNIEPEEDNTECVYKD